MTRSQSALKLQMQVAQIRQKFFNRKQSGTGLKDFQCHCVSLHRIRFASFIHRLCIVSTPVDTERKAPRGRWRGCRESPRPWSLSQPFTSPGAAMVGAQDLRRCQHLTCSSPCTELACHRVQSQTRCSTLLFILTVTNSPRMVLLYTHFTAAESPSKISQKASRNPISDAGGVPNVGNLGVYAFSWYGSRNSCNCTLIPPSPAMCTCQNRS